MKNHSLLLFCAILLFINLPIFCAPPKWLTELEKEYPSDIYLRSIGEGESIKQAEQEALSSVSMNFSAKVKVINKAIKEFNSIVIEDKTDSSKSYSFHQESTISSEADFLCLKFSEPFYDKKHKEYFIVGYINRADASAYYIQKINGLMQQLKIFNELSTKEKEPLYSLLNYQRAVKLGKVILYYIDTACLINPLESEKYNDDISFISQLQGNLQNLKKKSTFSIACNDARYTAITTGLSSILEESGFIVSKSNPIYRINVEVHFSEENYEAGNFVRPDLIILVSNAAGNAIESYSKAYPRYSHQSMKNAYSLAIVRIQQDLEENFLIDYRE